MTEKRIDVERGHAFDGIQEFDNPLPRWWLFIFYATVLFGYGYWVHYHVTRTGLSGAAAYEAEKAEATRRAAATKPITDELLLSLSRDPQTTGAGQRIFVQQCAQCHLENGSGKIGPNLTDEYWLHGNKPTEILGTISRGVVEKGMPAWEPTLGGERVRSLAAFVISREGTNLPGKEPQGERLGIIK
ncbi:MAG TPA: cbb3-type cytochrome c oxidase N-terminal domain-containing protein [Myxococcaceae bacterium]|nr:cbb3-type cytochrome c oxidase N-terminal domain-containing protein [Myxococcaceae bacterium]